MLAKLTRFVKSSDHGPTPIAVPEGQRVYAVGDVHGRLDLLRALAEAIEADDGAREPAATTIVLLGDLIDRGPESAGVIAFARAWQQRRDVRVLMANHEQMLLAALDKPAALRDFVRFGGRETLLSYGMDQRAYDEATIDELFDALPGLIPEADIAWIRGLADYALIGDYLFVHAGIAPGVPLDEQEQRHFYWIREPFLSHRKRHAHMIVHGHTIVDAVEERPNRIALDTGAYRTGRLTAMAFEGTKRRLIAAIDEAGSVHIEGA